MTEVLGERREGYDDSASVLWQGTTKPAAMVRDGPDMVHDGSSSP